ncbi:hypothetical protein L195_g056600, partial [Trifolium pratense]
DFVDSFVGTRFDVADDFVEASPMVAEVEAQDMLVVGVGEPPMVSALGKLVTGTTDGCLPSLTRFSLETYFKFASSIGKLLAGLRSKEDEGVR